MAEGETPVPEQTESTEPKIEQTTQDSTEDSDDEVEYVCPPEFDEREDMRKMFVGGLDKDTTDEEFKELFTGFGEVHDFIIIRKENMKSDRRFGFITFTKCDDLQDCLLKGPHKYKDTELDVSRAVPRGPKNASAELEHSKVKKLHVAPIPKGFEEKTLKKYLISRHPKKYGTIEEIKIPKEDDGTNKGFGFVKVSTEDFADRIAIAESKFTLDGNNMRINKAKTQGARNPRRGGMRGNNQFGGGWNQWQGYGPQGGYGGYGPQGGYGGYEYYGNSGYGGGYGGYGSGYTNFGPSSGRGGGRGRFKPY